MVSKSTNEKLKQGIAVRFHGEEGMVSASWRRVTRPSVRWSSPASDVICRARASCGSGSISSPTRSSIPTMLSSPSQLMVPHSFLFLPP